MNTWIRRNIDQKQLFTIVAAGLVTGLIVYGARKAGMGTVANVVKGG